MLEKLKLQLKILQLQLEVLILQRKKTIPNLADPKYIIIHHGGGDWNFEQVNKHHTDKWGFISSLGYGIGYQYFISYSGRVYQGRADTEEGAHTLGGYNRNSIGICLQGNMDIEEPTLAQMTALEKLVKEKKARYNINKVNGHRNFSNTSCPGQNLYQLIINF